MWAIHFGVYLHITAARVSLFNGHRFSGGRAGHIPTPLSQEHTQSTAFYEQAIAEFPSANLDNVLQSHNTVYYMFTCKNSLAAAQLDTSHDPALSLWPKTFSAEVPASEKHQGF